VTWDGEGGEGAVSSVHRRRECGVEKERDRSELQLGETGGQSQEQKVRCKIIVVVRGQGGPTEGSIAASPSAPPKA
jgi:hypothetical protein